MDHGIKGHPAFYGSTTVGERGQVVIPMEAREKLGLDKGEKLLVMGFSGDNLMLMKFSNFKKMQEKLSKTQEFITKIIKES